MNTAKKIIITGGCGYLGSITGHALRKEGYIPLLLDNFSTSHRGKTNLPGELFEVDLKERSATEKVFSEIGPVHAIIHFAAHGLVPESIQNPGLYFHNNLNATLTIAECAAKFKIPYLIHSSSCAVYGTPAQQPISEGEPLTRTEKLEEVITTMIHLTQL